MRQEERKAEKKAVQPAQRQVEHIQREREKQLKQAQHSKMELHSKLEKQHEDNQITHRQREQEAAAFKTHASVLKRKLGAVQSEALTVQNEARPALCALLTFRTFSETLLIRTCYRAALRTLP